MLLIFPQKGNTQLQLQGKDKTFILQYMMYSKTSKNRCGRTIYYTKSMHVLFKTGYDSTVCH